MVDSVRAMRDVPVSERSTAELLSSLSDQLGRLVRTELRLAQAELRVKGKQAGVGAGLLGTAAVIALFGAGTLIACAVLALALVLPAWLSALIVGVALIVIAGVAALLGRSRLRKSAPPVPESALASTKLDVEAFMDGVKR